jgi:hypothetical protein
MKHMKRKIILLSIPILVIGLLYLVLRIVGPNIFSDSPSNIIYERDKVRDYNEQIAFIFDLSDKFTVAEIGTISSEMYTEYKMYKISYGNAKGENTKKYLFVSGVHGHEPAPVYAVKEFIQYLDSIEPIIGIAIDFMYIVNPYGFEHNYLYGASHINIDRDQIRLKAQETNYFRNSVNGIKYDVVYDLHEDNSRSATGCYMFYYTRKTRDLAVDMLEMLRKNNAPINDEYKIYGSKAEGGALYLPFYAKILAMHFGKFAGAGLYFDSIKTEQVFVFETPGRLELKERTRIHLLLLKYIVGFIDE